MKDTTDNKTTATEKVRTRHLALAAGVMLLLACGIFGSLFYLQRQATLSKSVAQQRTAAEQAALEPTSAEVTKRIAHLRELREKWRPWALKHKEELKRMLNAQPHDQAALAAVYNALPARPTIVDAGFTSTELRSGPVRLGWQPGAKLWAKAKISDPKRQKQNAEDIRGLAEEMQQNFAAIRDIKLSSSMNPGRAQTVFWASGRITENQRIDNPTHGPGQPALVQATPQEIEPPYDFLM